MARVLLGSAGLPRLPQPQCELRWRASGGERDPGRRVWGKGKGIEMTREEGAVGMELLRGKSWQTAANED